MLELLPVALAIFAVCAANYTDLKKRIIPNKLTLPLIVAGVIFYALLGFYKANLWTSMSGALGAALAFAIGYAMWLAGGWAGGDVKLFTALGALLPKYTPPYGEAPYPFPLTLLFNSVIGVAPILLAYIVISCVRKPGVGGRIISPLRRSALRYIEAPWVLIGCSALGLEASSLLGLGWLRWPFIALLIFILYRVPFKVRFPIAAALTLYRFYLAPLAAAEAFLIILCLLPSLRLLISAIGVANREVLQKEVKITELKEGMIPAETIYEKGGKVGRYVGAGYGELLRQALRNPSKLVFKPKWDRVLANPRVAAGVTRSQVRALRQLVRKGELEDHIRIKKGMPFAPAFGLGLFIAIFFGDIYWYTMLTLSGL